MLFSSSKLCNSCSVGVVGLLVNILSYSRWFNINVYEVGALDMKVVGVEGVLGVECSVVMIVGGVLGEVGYLVRGLIMEVGGVVDLIVGVVAVASDLICLAVNVLACVVDLVCYVGLVGVSKGKVDDFIVVVDGVILVISSVVVG